MDNYIYEKKSKSYFTRRHKYRRFDEDVGKTSILQVLHGEFQDKMANTLGACFQRYETDDGRGDTIKMDLWDTAGQEKFRSLLTLYYKNSDAVIIVFDVNDPNTFKTVDYWAKQI